MREPPQEIERTTPEMRHCLHDTCSRPKPTKRIPPIPRLKLMIASRVLLLFPLVIAKIGKASERYHKSTFQQAIIHLLLLLLGYKQSNTNTYTMMHETKVPITPPCSANNIDIYTIGDDQTSPTFDCDYHTSTTPRTSTRTPNDNPFLNNINTVAQSNLYFDDVDLNEGGDASALEVAANTSSNKRHYRNIIRPVLMSILVVAILASVIATIAVSASRKGHVDTSVESSEGGDLRANWMMPSDPVTTPFVPDDIEDGTEEDQTLEYDGEEDFYYTEDPEMTEREEYLEDDEDEFFMDPINASDADQDLCVPTISFQGNLAETFSNPSCEDCIPQVALDGNTAVVKNGDEVSFYSIEDEEWVKSSKVYRSTDADVGLAIFGDTAIMSDVFEEDDTGAVYVLDASLNGHVRIEAPEDIIEGGLFGYSIDLNEDQIIVGAPYGQEDKAGSAYIYRRLDDEWELEAVLPFDEEKDTDFLFFGESVAIKDNRAAISAFNEDDEVVVFIFEYDSTTDSWAEIEEIVVDDQCDDCEDVGVEVSFTDDGGLLIAYQRNDSVSYFVPQFEVLDYVMLSKGQDYIWWDDLLSEEEDNLELSQVAMSGNIMVVSTFDEFDNAIASVYTQTEDAYWEEVDEIVLPAIDDENFDYESDMEISISGTNLLISYGGDVLWYKLDGCQ